MIGCLACHPSSLKAATNGAASSEVYGDCTANSSVLASALSPRLGVARRYGNEWHRLPDDYQALLDILDSAIKQQREHTMGML